MLTAVPETVAPFCGAVIVTAELGVGVAVGVAATVAVGVAATVAVGVAATVAVGVAATVDVGVATEVGVGVGVDPEFCTVTVTEAEPSNVPVELKAFAEIV
jgi:hypothetical protein